MSGENSSTKYSLGVFFLVGALLLFLHANRFVLTNDEGILLEPAQRLAEGARPYVDFFGYMSPGSYWIQALLFRLFGTSFWVGRIPVILGASVQAALVFWLVARLASRNAAAATVALFVGFQLADPTFLTAQHRWDSATLALAGVCCAMHLGKRGIAASGALLMFAAWCTPSVGLVMVVVGLWLLLLPDRRTLLVPFVAGAGVVAVAAAGTLWTSGSLAPFIRQMLWLKQNYSAVNVMPYGSVIGGYGALLEGATGGEAVVRVLLILCLALPAILPLLGGALGLVVAVRTQDRLKNEVLLLMLATAALVVSAFPRADLMHLAFIAAIPYVLVATGVARLLPVRAGAVLAFAFIPFAAMFSVNGFAGLLSARPVSTPMGTLRAAAEVAPDLQKLVAAVRPGETLFVYPYMPVLYSVTQAKNPTRFAFLAPGMMTQTEENVALAELSARPPDWLMYMQVTREEYLRVFPNATKLNHSFAAIEQWMQANYIVATSSAVNIRGYQLWKRAR